MGAKMNYKINTLNYAVSSLAGRGPPGLQKKPFFNQTFNKIHLSYPFISYTLLKQDEIAP